MSEERFADQPPSASPLPWTIVTSANNAFV